MIRGSAWGGEEGEKRAKGGELRTIEASDDWRPALAAAGVPGQER